MAPCFDPSLQHSSSFNQKLIQSVHGIHPPMSVDVEAMATRRSGTQFAYGRANAGSLCAAYARAVKHAPLRATSAMRHVSKGPHRACVAGGPPRVSQPMSPWPMASIDYQARAPEEPQLQSQFEKATERPGPAEAPGPATGPGAKGYVPIAHTRMHPHSN